jgi:hypothetical protein
MQVSRTGRTTAILAVIVAALALGVSACGSSNSGSSGSAANASTNSGSCQQGHVHFAKPKFVLSAGVAAGMFHAFIYKPLRAGAFKKGAPGRLSSFAKAAAATAVITYAVKKAHKYGMADEHLCKYVGKLDAFGAKIGGMAASLRKNKEPADLAKDDSAISGLQQQLGIKDRTVPLGG